jgi:hypothetical protein
MRPQTEDTRVRVLNALFWDLAVPRDRLNVDVENGWGDGFRNGGPALSKGVCRVRRARRFGRDRRNQPNLPSGHSNRRSRKPMRWREPSVNPPLPS